MGELVTNLRRIVMEDNLQLKVLENKVSLILLNIKQRLINELELHNNPAEENIILNEPGESIHFIDENKAGD